MLLSALAALQIASYTAYAEESPRNVKTLTDWEFRGDHDWKAEEGWTAVKVPHDWASTRSAEGREGKECGPRRAAYH